MGGTKIDKIGLNTKPVQYPILQYGSSGTAVTQLQQLLNGKGYKLTIDGVYGSITARAVLDFQRLNALYFDGIAGPQTLGKLGFSVIGLAQPVPTALASISTSAKGFLPGIDVSGYQPNTDWKKVKAAGCEFAIIKASEGVSVSNPYFAGDWLASKANGIIPGAYHFFHPASDPIAQAQHYLNAVGILNPDDIPACLDWEIGDAVPVGQQIVAALAWLNQVEIATKKTPIIYTSPSFAQGLALNPQFSRFGLWISHWGVSAPSIPESWVTWNFWQYINDQPYPGVTTTADLNYFNGSLEDLKSFITKSTVV